MSVPVVALAAFANLCGPALSADLRRLVAEARHDALVLFSDTAGEQLAILPVGPGETYPRLEAVRGAVIEGLRPLCALSLAAEPARDAAPSPSRPAPRDSADRQAELDRREESLRVRERYIAECEQKLAEVGHSLSEREAMLEQREQMLIAKERDFFRRGGERARAADESAARLAAEQAR